mmetsp:Transcript_8011/g.12928  ORF Transcript_8011/g.12928 Transcript_8011/m.12928 type:complete len:676 (+) Transcript_8011:43-2070(+)
MVIARDKLGPEYDIIPLVGIPDGFNNFSNASMVELVSLSFANLVSLVLMYVKKRNKWAENVPEQMVPICVGVMVGGCAMLLDNEELSENVTYNFSSVFFGFFLPAIVFSHAYSVKHKSFFRNLSGILCFSIFGTMLSTCLIGFGVYYAFQMDIVETGYDKLSTRIPAAPGKLTDHTGMPLVDCLILGSMFSAVDPGVSFSVLPRKIESQVNGLLFGEQVLNSAIAIVLYNSFRVYHEVLVKRGQGLDAMYVEDFTRLGYRFCVITSLSMLVGIAIGLASASLFKTVNMKHSPSREQAVIILFAYLSYLIPRAAELSPVVSLFLCGATMAHYTFYNISVLSQIASSTWIRTIGVVAETFVFVFIGASIFTVQDNEWRPRWIVVMIILCITTRFAQISILSTMINIARFIMSHQASWSRWLPCRCLSNAGSSCLRTCHYCDFGSSSDRATSYNNHHEAPGYAPRAYRVVPQYLSFRTQLVISWAGLRGAVLFALALHAPVLNQKGQMLTTTVSVILFSYLVQGPTLQALAKKLLLQKEDEQEYEKEPSSDRLVFRSPSNIMALGQSPQVAALFDDNAPLNYIQPSTGEGNLNLDDDYHAPGGDRYGTFTSAWRSFDEKCMKPLFGGKLRGDSSAHAGGEVWSAIGSSNGMLQREVSWGGSSFGGDHHNRPDEHTPIL